MLVRPMHQSPESQTLEKKSLRKVAGSSADFDQLARDCVCMANAVGGKLWIGVEDESEEPPRTQRIEPALLEVVRRKIAERTVNVQLAGEIAHHANGGEFIVLSVARAVGVASTTDGRYFLRVGDVCRPVVGDDVLRLVNERPATPWEQMTSLGVRALDANRAKLEALCGRLRSSARVKASVKEKTDRELLVHYGLAHGDLLTNLGILLIGDSVARAALGSAPVVQAIQRDERGLKVAKWSWDDHELSPVELVDAIWSGLPVFRESYELPDGMFRSQLPAFDESVVRELLVNALVHRPYTQRGDLYLNVHPDRLEVVNPGRLPLGVTPRNILHESRRRNDALARVFHDLALMEREGSGIDHLFERLLVTGRRLPTIHEGDDSVQVTVPRVVVQPGVAALVVEADRRFRLTQRERITLGLIAQHEAVSASVLARELELPDGDALRSWLARLVSVGLVEQTGRTKATRYFVPPGLMRQAGLDALTTLARVQPHRLRALILEDLERFPNSGRADIHRRIGSEIHAKTVSRVLDELRTEGSVIAIGERRWRTYRLADPRADEV
jgi:ATP-dependent DNA helicase RecG